MDEKEYRERLLNEVRGTMERSGVPPVFRRMVLGVSGGADSTALALILREVLLGTELVLVHIDHRLPEAESANDLDGIREWCRGQGLRIREVVVNVRAAMRDTGESLEMAARRLRHEALQGVAREVSAEAIALGHNADDQVETMILRLARGTGPTGLGGIRVWIPGGSEKVGVLRPLLGCSRESLRTWLALQGISWCEDPTNAQDDVLRNRVRHAVLPALYAALGTEAREGFLRTSELLREEEDDWLIPLVEEAVSDCSLGPNALSLPHVARHPLPLRRRILLRALYRAGVPAKVISHEKLRLLETALYASDHGTQSYDVGGGFTLCREYDRLSVLRPSLAPDTKATSSLRVEPDVGFQKTQRCSPETRPLSAWVSQLTLLHPECLSVRPLQPGDRIHPVGALGSTKISDILIDRKIPRSIRETIEVVCDSSNRVIWLPGHSIDTSVCVTSPDAPSWRLTLR